MRAAIEISKFIMLIIVIVVLLIPIYLWISETTKKVTDAEGFVLISADEGESILTSSDVNGLIQSTLAYSIITALVGAFIHSSIAFGLAYGLARGRFPLREELKMLTFIALMVPASVILGPLFWINSRMGLHDHFAGMYLAMWSVPWLTLPLYFYLNRLPDRMEHYGAMDGLNPYKIFTHLILPYSYKGLIAIFSLSFLINYHSLFAAAAALPFGGEDFHLKTSSSYLPLMITFFKLPETVLAQSTKLLAALIFQLPTI
ncbi:MAG: ABC transporter permease subunit, partial [Candidatus Marinimicrobia bacterium]|nr:ABC transporter permease subunit [Candidatus Neomarinimicrobiota bacterium]